MAQRRTVSVRLDDITKTAMDFIRADERMKTGRKLTNDGVIWLLIEGCREDIKQRISDLYGDVPEQIKIDHRFKKDQQ